MRTIRFVALCLAGSCLAPSVSAQAPDIPARLSLDEVLRLVEQRHPSLAAARSRVAVADATAISARQRPNPAFSFSSEGYSPWLSRTRSPDAQETVVEVAQELETGGRRRLRGAVAQAGAAASRAGVDDGRRQLRLEAQRSYFELVLARLEAGNARAALAEIDKVIELNRSRYEQGEVSGAELRRLEVERMRFSDDLLLADLAEKNARAALLSLLGAPRLDAPLDPTDSLAVPAPAAPSAAGSPQASVIDASRLIARALANRGDLAAARHESDRARADVQLQHALRLPTVTFGGGYRRDFGASGLVVSASVPLPLFDRNEGGVARAEAEQRLAAAEVDRAERAVSLEVQRAINGAAAMGARLASIESGYLQKAREARDSALAAYRSGATDLIDYLDAQRAYRDVQRAHERALFDVRMSLFQLDAATGVLPGDSSR